jgi:hypothetical protein
MNREVEWILKEEVMAYFKLTSRTKDLSPYICDPKLETATCRMRSRNANHCA